MIPGAIIIAARHIAIRLVKALIATGLFVINQNSLFWQVAASHSPIIHAIAIIAGQSSRLHGFPIILMIS